MSPYFAKIRYYLEIIALPAFIYLVVHLAGHGASLLLDADHSHDHEHSAEHGHHEILETLFSTEVLLGVILAAVFVWIWHRPMFRKWVPCTHDHCHGELPISHTIATIALCLHFFPEASIRQELFADVSDGNILSIAGIIGFGTHFFIDVIVAAVLSSYWKHTFQRILSFGGITICWIAAFFVAKHFTADIPHVASGMIALISSFLLAMFVHKPHKPNICKCD